MKAKEYAEQIIRDTEYAVASNAMLAFEPGDTDENRARLLHTELVKIGCMVALTIHNEMCEATGKVKTEQAIFGAYREGLTKWKSVVSKVYDKFPLHPVTDNYIGLLIAMHKPKTFELLVKNKVFLGYTFSEKESLVLHKLKVERETPGQLSISMRSMAFIGALFAE